MKIKISIIIPTYNDEEYILRCLDSIEKQDYQNYEVIVVDDESTDGTISILEKYAKNNNKINVYFSSHNGCGTTRNIALEHATGDYILFLDSDDELLPNCLPIISKEIEENNIDILVFDTKIIFHGNQKPDNGIINYYKRQNEISNKILTSSDFYNQSIEYKSQNGYGYPAVIWTYAYKKEIYNNLRFLHEIHGDEYFTTCLFLLKPNQKIKYIDKKLHLHYIRDNSISTSSFNIKYPKAYIDIIHSLLPLSTSISDTRVLKNLYLNLRGLLYSCMYQNSKIIEGYKYSPENVINEIIKPIIQHKKKLNAVCLTFIKMLVNDATKAYGIDQNNNINSIVKTIDKIIEKNTLQKHHDVSWKAKDKLDFYRVFKRPPNIVAPKYLNEKILYRKRHSCLTDPKYPILADKYLVRNFVSEKIGDSYLIPLYDKFFNIDELTARIKNYSDFILKPNHGSGMVQFVDKVDSQHQLINIINISNKWLNLDFSTVAGEMHYSSIPRCVLVEKRIGKKELSLSDYKIHMFRQKNNKFFYVLQIVDGRFNNQINKTFYVNNLTTPYSGKHHLDSLHIDTINKAIELSKILLDDLEYARIDWYIEDKQLYFGEITLTSEAGLGHGYGDELDLLMGEKWDLSLSPR